MKKGIIIGIIIYCLINILSFITCFIFILSIILYSDKVELLSSTISPNGKYRIDTFRSNCGATCSFGIIGELCDNKNKCKEIYRGYKEYSSYVYWIDNKTIFINNKILNVFTEKYDYRKDDNYYEKRYTGSQNNE